LERRVWDLDGRDLSHIPDEVVEAYDYFGATVDEGLAHIADELRLHYFIDLDNVFQMYRSDTVPAPFDLDNDAPDYVTTYPFREWSYARDSVELANAVLVEPEKRKHSRWSVDSTSIAAYGRQERFVSDGNLHRAKQARNVGARTLATTKDPTVEGGAIVDEPGIWAGMTVHVTEALWERDEDVFVSNVEIVGVDPHDDEGEAYLRSTLTFSDKRRRRRAAKDSINKNTRRRPGQVSDVNPYDIDAFGRVVAPPSWSEDASLGILNTYQASRGQTVDWDDIPFSVGSAAIAQASSYVGQWYKAWTTEDCGCPGLDNCFKGWMDIERWYYITVPAHPADAAGVLIAASAPALDGVAGSYGARVVVRSAYPTDTWQGTPVGTINAAGDIFIPIGLVPAAGGVLHVGLQAGWQCNYGMTVCGWTWPFTSGAENSGRYRASLSSPRWAVWDTEGGDMGSAATVAKAPWEGGNEWRDGGTEGSPVYGADGEAYYVTAEALGGHGLYMVGEREDEDEPRGPWSDTAWGVEVTFDVDAVGDVGTSGPRHIQVTTTGEGEAAVGTVHLGDSATAPGISVGGPTTTVYRAVTIVAGDRYRVRFDTRSGKVRGKLWRVLDGEPAAWDVETPMEETEDDADRWSLWVRCGNGVGDSQTVRIFRIRAQQDADDGKRVEKEYIGLASGTENRFASCHPFREGTLRAFVNGIGVGPSWEDGDGAAFKVDFWPTARSIIRASYVVDQGEGDE
jgi:hypothetical protein